MAKGDEHVATMTIEYVEPQPGEPWTGGNTPMWFPECRFSDGSIGSGIAFSAVGAGDVIKALQALVDTPTEFTLVDNDTYNGKQKWKLKSYPGKPATGGGGGGKGGGGGMTAEQVALLAAASALGPSFAKDDVTMTLVAMAEDIAELASEINRRGGQTVEDNSSNGQAGIGEGIGEASAVPAPAPSEVLSLAQLRQLRKLGAEKGLADNDAIAQAAGVDSLQALTPDDADLLIEAWSAS